MKNILTVVIFFTAINCFAQLNPNYVLTENTKLYKVIINESFVEERAYYIANSIMKSTDVIFSFADYKTQTVYTYLNADKDAALIQNSISKIGYSVKSQETIQSSNDIYLYLYYQYYSKETKLLSEADMAPPKFKTGNVSRDYSLYITARKYWGQKYPDRIKNLPITDENEARIILTNDFPIWLSTGHEKQDEETYETKKKTWILNHPDLFEKIKHLNWDKLSNKPDNN